MRRTVVYLNIVFIYSFVYSQKKMSPEEYVSKYYELAVAEMNQYKIPASITLAQGLIETESGNSLLATKANNHFGIKCKSEWTGATFIKDDDTKNECFRAYGSVEESYRDHSLFLLKPRYSALFSHDMSDYRAWAYGLKRAGYATNPNYPAMLIKYIEDYKLFQFDHYGKDKFKTVSNNSAEPSKPTLSKEEQIKRRKILANNVDLVIVDEHFDLYKLASQTRLPLNTLMEYNDIEGEQSLRLGQNFFIQKKAKVASKDQHTVLIGESLYDISQIYGVSLKSLRKYNKLESWEQPRIGETIYLNKLRDDVIKTRPFLEIERERQDKKLDIFIPIDMTVQNGQNTIIDTIENKLQGNKKENTNPNSGKPWINHTVKADETIFRICKMYAIRPQDLLVWNGIEIEESVKPGQMLRIQTDYPNGIPLDPPIVETNPQEYENSLSANSLTEAIRKQQILDSISKLKPKKDSTLKSINHRLDPKLEWINHTVQPKETFYKLSKQYQTTPQDIQVWNGMAPSQPLSIGQVLRIRNPRFVKNNSSSSAIREAMAPEEPNKPRVTILKAPPSKVKDTTNPNQYKVERIKMSELYNQVRRDTSRSIDTIPRRIKLTGE